MTSSAGSTPMSSGSNQSTPAIQPVAIQNPSPSAANSPFGSTTEETAPAESPQGNTPVVTRSDNVLEQRIAEDMYDTDAWQQLLKDVQNENDIAKVREVFERFLKVFPTSVSQTYDACLKNVKSHSRYADEQKNKIPNKDHQKSQHYSMLPCGLTYVLRNVLWQPLRLSLFHFYHERTMSWRQSLRMKT